MAGLRAVLAELVGLFIDDGSLALLTVLLVAGLGLAALMRPDAAPVLGGLLLAGCLALLAWSTLRGGRA